VRGWIISAVVADAMIQIKDVVLVYSLTAAEPRLQSFAGNAVDGR